MVHHGGRKPAGPTPYPRISGDDTVRTHFGGPFRGMIFLIDGRQNGYSFVEIVFVLFSFSIVVSLFKRYTWM